jgi:hypothetical protein
MSPRRAIGTTIGAAAAAVRHVGWWLEWQARSSPASGSRERARA